MSKGSLLNSKIYNPDKDMSKEQYQRGIADGVRQEKDRTNNLSKDSAVDGIKKGLKLITGIKVNKDFINKWHFNPQRKEDIYMRPSTNLTSCGGVKNLAEATDPRFLSQERLKARITEEVSSDPIRDIYKEYLDQGYSREEVDGAIKDLVKEKLLIKAGGRLQVR